MNPIARMMKRYINTPLKYALPLLFVGALVLVSISGCTSPSSTSTATPTPTNTAAAPVYAATAGCNPSDIDSRITAIMQQIPNIDTSNLTCWGAQPTIEGQLSRVLFTYGSYDGAAIYHFNTVANATKDYNKLVQNYVNQSYSTETPVFWGLSYYAKAAGHAPTVKNAQTFYVGGDNKIHDSFIQYDNVVIDYSHQDVPFSS